jgi:hypothetical protein
MKADMTSHRIERWPVLGCASALLALVAVSDCVGAIEPTGCTSIANVPVATISYGAAIQHGIFQDFTGVGQGGCADCHTSGMGVSIPPGGLDLDPAESPSPYVNLINVESADYPGMKYVVPGRPEQSLLFWKVNCDSPVYGSRMPLSNYAGGLSAEQQAEIYDWIAAGAPAGTTDAIFRGTFDLRGFVP